MQPVPRAPEGSRIPDLRLPEIHQLLLAYYGAPAQHELRDPLTQLIDALISSGAGLADSQARMRRLRVHFSSWEELRDATAEEIGRAIAEVPGANAKALRLKAILLQITARYGSLTLDFLARYRTEKIREWLESFEGVGPQISAAVVNCSTLRRRALCVDPHHLRVAQRLALTPRADAATTEQRLLRIIPETWNAAMLEQHHALVKLHGQSVCTFVEPACGSCPLLALCPFGDRRVEGPPQKLA